MISCGNVNQKKIGATINTGLRQDGIEPTTWAFRTPTSVAGFDIKKILSESLEVLLMAFEKLHEEVKNYLRIRSTSRLKDGCLQSYWMK